VQAFRLSQTVEVVPAFLHVAVFLFFTGLVDFLFSVDATIGPAIFGILCFFGGVYVLLTFLPNVRPNCPYTVGRRSAGSRSSGSSSFPQRRGATVQDDSHALSELVQSLLWTMSDAIRSQQVAIERRALRWVVVTVGDDDDIESLVD